MFSGNPKCVCLCVCVCVCVCVYSFDKPSLFFNDFVFVGPSQSPELVLNLGSTCEESEGRTEMVWSAEDFLFLFDNQDTAMKNGP